MSEEMNQVDQVQPEDASAPKQKPWSTPVLTVRSVGEITLGTRAVDRSDASFFFS